MSVSSSDLIVCWGEVLWDRFPDGDRLGGAPANVAWHLAMLGARAALVTRVGDDDDGRAAVARLAARGVDTSLVQIDPERATGEVTVRIEVGEPRYTLVPGRAWERIAATPEALSALRDARAIVYGTLSQRTPEGMAAWREALRATGPETLKVFDPNLRPTDADPEAVVEGMRVADIVKLGEREAAQITRALGRRDLLDWLLTRREPRARLVAITRGAGGSTLHTARERIEVPAIDATPGGDNVGCGDAYVAVLAHGVARGWALGDIAGVAARWAGHVACVRGATPDLDPDTIARLTADRLEALPA